MSILIGGHAAQTEREGRGIQILLAGNPPPSVGPISVFNDLSWHAPRSASGLRLTAAAGGTIRKGHKGFYPVPCDCTIVGNTILANTTGSIEFDIDRVPLIQFPPADNQSLITLAASRPQLNGAPSARDLALFSWTTTLKKGDVLGFRVIADTNLNWVMLALHIVRAG